MASRAYRVLFEPEEDGSVHAFAPELPGVHTYGATRDEAYERIREAAVVYVQDMVAEGEEPPAGLEEAEFTVPA
jgi:predicted RNase H-like HicB family nuclease